MAGIFGVDVLHVLVIGDVRAAHRFEVRRFELTINDAPHSTDHEREIDECHFGGTWRQGEHALAEEIASYGHAVQTADEFGILPDFDTHGEVHFMQFLIRRDHPSSKPCAHFLITPLRLAAILDDLVKRLVERDMVFVLIDERAHGMTDVDVFGKDDESVLRAMP